MRKFMITAGLLASIATSGFCGVPIAWDIRLGMDTMGSAPTPYNVTAARGETLDFMPRFTDRGVPLAITTNSAIRVYLREQGGTNAFTASYLSGTAYTNAADLGRVRVSLLPSDIVAATNQFFVGCDVGGRIYRAYGKLTMLDSPGGEPGTNTTVRGIVDWATIDSVNANYAPFLPSSYTYTPTASNLAAIASMVAPSTTNIVTAAIAAIPATVRLADSAAPATYFQTVSYGTGTVWQVGYTVVANHYMAYFSDDALISGVHPVDTVVTQGLSSTIGGLTYTYDGTTFTVTDGGPSMYAVVPPAPSVMTVSGATGSGAVSNLLAFGTNAVSTFATDAKVDALRADFDAYVPPPANVVAAVNPYALAVYGNVALTNTAGFAAMATTNGAAVSITKADPTNGQALASFFYALPTTNTLDADTATLSFHVRKTTGGTGTSQVAYAVSTVTSGTEASVVVASGTSLLLTPTTTNVTASVTAARQTGVIGFRVDITAAGDPGTHDIQLYTGGATPFALTVPIVPTAYVTQGQIAGLGGTAGAITNGTDGASLTNAMLDGATSFRGGGGSSTIEQRASGGMTMKSVAGNLFVYVANSLVGFFSDTGFGISGGKELVFGGNDDVQMAYTAGGFSINTKSRYGGGTVNTVIPFGTLCVSNGVCTTALLLYDYGTQTTRTGTMTNGVLYWQ